MKFNFDPTEVRASTYAAISIYISFLFTLISFCTPYWLSSDGKLSTKHFENLGLWEACFTSFFHPNYLYDREYRGCKWIFDEDYAFLLNFLEPHVSHPVMNKAPLSDARLGAIAVLTFSFVITLIAFVTPYWLASDRRLYGAEFDKLGLWETCFRSLRGPNDLEYSKYYSGCRWIFFYEYKNIRSFLLPAFFVFTQILFTIGFVLVLLALIAVLAIQLCFVIEKEIYAMKLLAIDLSASAFCCTCAVIIFGIWGDDRDWMPDPEHNFLSWSFALAVVGSFFQWVAACLFWIENRILYKKQMKKHNNYAMRSHE